MQDAKGGKRRGRLGLSRRPGQRVIIEVPGREDIEVTLEAIEGGKARLVFDAETDVGIYREELYED